MPKTLGNLIANSLKPPVVLNTADWADQYRYIPPESGAESGRWKTDRAPYQRGLMNAYDEPYARRISFMLASQLGKSEIQLNIIAKFIHLDPCPMLFLQPTLEMAESFSKERFSPTVRDTPVLRKKVTSKSRDGNSTILHKSFDGGHLTFAGANSPASLASRPIKVLQMDEVDRYTASVGEEGDPVWIASRRTTNFWDAIIGLSSTPTIKGESRIEKEYLLSDQRRYFVPCPHCNEYQILLWENFQYPGKSTGNAKPDAIAYRCAHCEEMIEETDKASILAQGEWRATAVGKPGIIGFQLSAFYSPWQSWVDIAYDYEAARLDPFQMQVWTNTVLGMPYERDGSENVDWQLLRERSQNPPDGKPYSCWKVPDGVLMLTAGVDVQNDRLEVSVWGWGEGEQAWALGHAQIPGDPKGDEVWQQLDSLLSTEFEHELGSSLKVSATCIDSGFATQEVYAQIRARTRKRWFAIKGSSSQTKPLIGKPKPMDITYQGKTVKRGVSLREINTDMAKSTLMGRVTIAAPGPRYFRFASDLDTDFFEGICSEVHVCKHVNKVPKYSWVKKDGTRNEPLDCMVYAYAAAQIAGLPRINWKNEAKKLQSRINAQKMLENGEIKPIENDEIAIENEQNLTEIPENTTKKRKKLSKKQSFGNPFA